VPAEVGKVGVESPTFIEPVQKRKDGIEAMFMRQAKAKEAEAGSGKRKHEPSSEVEETCAPEAATASGTSVPSRSSVKRAKVKAENDPIRVTVKPQELIIDVDIVDADDPAERERERDNSSDVEILPGPSSPQSVSSPSPSPGASSLFLTHVQISSPRVPSQGRRRMSEMTQLCRIRSSSRSSSHR